LKRPISRVPGVGGAFQKNPPGRRV
jgi:hypothetical protein